MVEVNCSHRIAQGLLVPLSSSSLGPSSSRRRAASSRLAPSPRRYQEPAAPQQPPRYARLLPRRANLYSFASYFRLVSPVFQCHLHVSRATRLAILRSSVMVEILSPISRQSNRGPPRVASGRRGRRAGASERHPCGRGPHVRWPTVARGRETRRSVKGSISSRGSRARRSGGAASTLQSAQIVKWTI